MRKELKKIIALTMAVSCLFMTACSNNTTSPSSSSSVESSVSDVDGKLVFSHDEEFMYANQLSIKHYEGGYATFTGAAMPDKTFLIVPEGKSVPTELEEGTVVLQKPLDKLTVCSTGMMSLIDTIGGLDNVKSVGTEVTGWYIDGVIEKMNKGDILFSGHYKQPDYEMLLENGIQLQIDTSMLSSVPDVMVKYDELGIPYFIESSSKEGHPLGRVEWVKLFGLLMDKEEEAKAYFDKQLEMVEAVTKSDKTDKTVAMFYIASSSDKVYARNGGDYNAKMIEMAGGNYILADMEPNKTGNTAVTFEELYAKCIDADYIFFVNFALKFNELEEMLEYNPLFADFKAVKDGTIYITSPSFTQSTAVIGNIIEDMHTVLTNPEVEVTNSLIKLK